MYKNNKLSMSIQLAITCGVLSTSWSAFAQEEQADGASNVERISITGSRIKRTDMESAQPVMLISKDDIGRTGLTAVNEVLKEIASNGTSLGLQTNNGNTSGATSVNLRNCGSNRSLVLVNGRRWVNGLGGSVDLSTIPMSAIERIEVLKDGASSIYGTDAICGVINIITGSGFEGAELSIYQGGYDEGDGKRESYTLTLGASSGKASVLASASYTKQEKVMSGDRDISSVPLYGFPGHNVIAGASGTTDYGNFNVNGTRYTLNPSNAGCLPNQNCTDTSQFKVYDQITDGYNHAPVNYLMQPNEARSIYVQGAYEIADNLTLKSNVVYNNRKSNAQLAAQPLSQLRVSADSVYNPFDVSIIGATYRPTAAPRWFGAEVDTWRYDAGLEGDFELAGRSFSWDAGYIYAENKMLNMKKGFFNTSKLNEALGASYIDANGTARCGTASATVAGCVPLNIFGGPTGVTQDMLDFIQVDPRNFEFQKMHNYTANISGEIFDLPSGPVAIGIGGEIRRESGYTSPDPLTVAGQVNGDNAAAPTAGGFNVKEIYGEVIVPILSGLEYVEHLELSLSSRYSDYSNFGSTTNSSAKVTYRVNSDVMFRGSYGEGFRAPSIQELYRGLSESRPQATDPCTITSNAYTSNADVRARCAAAGVPTNFVQNTVQLRSTIGGNEELQPETSKSKVLGIVYSPDYISGLGITLDWYNIKIENAIDTMTAQSIIDNCYVVGIEDYCGLITRDFTGALGNNGEVMDMVQQTRNFAGGYELEGIDLNIDYNFKTNIGNWRTTLDATYVIYDGDIGQLENGDRTRDNEISKGNKAGRYTAGISGGGSHHRLKATAKLIWSYDDWAASLSAQYFGKMTEDCNKVVDTANRMGQPQLANLCSNPDYRELVYTLLGSTEQAAPKNEIKATVYFDAQASWESPFNSRVTIGINNLLDKDPPVAYSAFAGSFDPMYRIPGRYFYVSYLQRF